MEAEIKFFLIQVHSSINGAIKDLLGYGKLQSGRKNISKVC